MIMHRWLSRVALVVAGHRDRWGMSVSLANLSRLVCHVAAIWMGLLLISRSGSYAAPSFHRSDGTSTAVVSRFSAFKFYILQPA